DLLYAQLGYAEPRGVAVHDYNNDGWMDIAVVLRNEDQRSGLIYVNDGTGRFPTQRPPVVSFSKEKASESIFAADLNRSGFIDIGFGYSLNPAKVEVFINDNVLSLKPWRVLDNLNADLELGAAADLTGDGNTDLVMGDFSVGDVIFAAFTGVQKDGTYLLPTYSAPKRLTAVQFLNSMELADIDADGDLDIAATGSEKNQLRFLWNSAADFQATQATIPSFPAKLVTGDVNADGALDIVVADTTGLLTFLINDVLSYQPPSRPTAIAPADRAHTSEQQPLLRWQVPSDPNANDSLQFRITLQGPDGVRIFTSWETPDAFSPSAKIRQGQGEVSFRVPQALAEGSYRWSVEAFDGLFWSEPSPVRRLTVDSTPPQWIDVSFPDAVFDNRWLTLEDALVRLRVVFREANPHKISILGGSLGGPFFFDAPAGGQSVTATLSFAPSMGPDGEYPLTLTLTDSAGQEAQMEKTVGIDRNPPTGAQTRVDASISASRTFRVYWSGGTDGTGSGLSGEYAVQYRQDDGPWTLWLQRTTKRDSLFTGVNGSRYKFEAAAYDRVGRRELLRNQAEAAVLVKQYAFDQTPPAAPINLRANGANPSPWQTANRFLISWMVPADETGIHSSFLKLGAPPTGNSDYEQRASGYGPVEINITSDGRTPLFVWLSDSAGNVDYRNRASVLLRRDATPPALQSFIVDSPRPNGIAADQTPWYNLQSFNQLVVGVTYLESFPDKVILRTDGLGDSLVNRGAAVGSGSPRKSTFSVPVVGAQSRSYLFRAVVADSAGNRAEGMLRLGLDGTPPSGSIASSPSLSTTDTFTVSWSAANDGNGSGVVRYDIYSKTAGGNWQLWHTASAPGKRTFTGQDKQTYFFEAVAVDLVGLSETLSSAGECSTRVDFAAADREAPPPPLNLRANGSNPSPWSNNPVFTITWQNPADATGIVRALWKIGQPPAVDYDTTGSAAATGTLQIRLTASGKQILYLWLIDGAGNTNFRNAATVLLRYDGVPPAFSLTRFVNPSFGNKWYNPLRDSNVIFEVTYQESFPHTLSLAAPELGFSFSTSELTAGSGVKKEIPFAIAGKADGNYLLRAALTDSAGNRAEAVDTLRLDGTPPFGARAVSPPISAALTFNVQWSPGQDAGVGLDGRYDVFVKQNDEGWRVWLNDFPGLIAPFTGQDGNRYAFEVLARDRLGNKEQQTGQAESVTLIDVNSFDNTPPDAPIDLRAGNANPSPWQKSRIFTLTWTSPPDPSGIARAFYKLDSPPSSNVDTTGSLASIPPVTVAATRQNGQRLFLWLMDGAGNVDYRNYASVLLRYDAVPPTIDSLVLSDPRPAADDMWYNTRVAPQKATLLVYGRDANLASVRLTPSALFAPSEVSPNSTAPTAAFSLSFPNFEDALIDLTVTLIDSAGNTAEAVKRLGLDGTPPRNTKAQSPDTVAPGEFVVFWNADQIVENGSGLSGVYSVRLKINDQPWTVWNAQYRGTSATFIGQEGNRYAFEVAAYDRVGNWEGFTGTPESVTFVTKKDRDTEPPPAPEAVTVNGQDRCPWSNSADFLVNWKQPIDPSGIARLFYKFYSPPTQPNDYSGSASATPPVRITAPSEGEIPVYLWLQDGSGNADHRLNARAVLRYDATAPTILQAAFTNAVNGKWFHPDSTNHAMLSLRYGEARPESLVLSFAGMETPKIILSSLAPGQEVPLSMPVVIADLDEGCRMLYLALTDSAGNRALDSLAVCLDSRPPYGAKALSPSRSASARFTISWNEAPGEDEGSGLSGEYDLRMSVNHGPWFDVLTRAKTFSYVYVGAHGNIFSFEAAAWDRVGNREPFTGIPESETVVDTTFDDRTAPPPPIGLNVAGANPSKWQNSPDFTVEWRHPSDPSGIAMAYWKLGSPPVHERDITDSLAVEEETGKIIVRLSNEGAYPLYVWLKDGRGNADRASAASILLRYDATPPILGTPQLLIQSQLPNYINPKKTSIVPIRIGFRELHPDSLLFWSESLGTNRISLGSAINDTVQFNISVAEVSDGLHRLFISLKDSAGNRSGKDSLIFHLDSRPPVINLMAADTLTEESRTLTLRAVVSDNDT
ncbi:MAG: FG-GAP-like repeat-containing protein, partial [candidate division KSB1 bacterium]|nr:FG-GAP-like repeat-containing protein [candidate division KSB1 bacterium]